MFSHNAIAGTQRHRVRIGCGFSMAEQIQNSWVFLCQASVDFCDLYNNFGTLCPATHREAAAARLLKIIESTADQAEENVQ